MATVHKDIVVNRSVDEVWALIRDVGAADRLFPGIVSESHLEGDARVVTFANGMVLRELIVTIDDTSRRFVYASVGGRATHHNAAIQVLAEGDTQSRIVWTTDVLPDTLSSFVRDLMERGIQVMAQTLEAQATK